MTAIGRKNIFRGKDRNRRLNIYITKIGRQRFTEARRALAKMVGWKVEDVSEGDTCEWCLRGRPCLVEQDGAYVEADPTP